MFSHGIVLTLSIARLAFIAQPSGTRTPTRLRPRTICRHIFFSSPRKSWRAPTPLRIGRWTRGIIPRQSMQGPLRFQQRPGHWLRAEEAALETDTWSGKLHCMIRYNRRAKRVAYMRRVTLGIRHRNGNTHRTRNPNKHINRNRNRNQSINRHKHRNRQKYKYT